jgi:hypothetical protein
LRWAYDASLSMLSEAIQHANHQLIDAQSDLLFR